MHHCPTLVVVAALSIAGAAGVAHAQEPTWMRGLDALLSAEVTSVSRKEQRGGDTSAAVYVLTREDIRRSGMQAVPDLLRLVPGLHVARASGNSWAVSSRGMGGLFAKYLLVMVDGRSIYSPYYAGVFWDAVDVPVDVIERTEVIRGPGASLWGANAECGERGHQHHHDDRCRPARDDGQRRRRGQELRFARARGPSRDLFGYRLFANASEYAALALPAGGDAGDDRQDRSIGGSFRGTTVMPALIDAHSHFGYTDVRRMSTSAGHYTRDTWHQGRGAR